MNVTLWLQKRKKQKTPGRSQEKTGRSPPKQYRQYEEGEVDVRSVTSLTIAYYVL